MSAQFFIAISLSKCTMVAFGVTFDWAILFVALQFSLSFAHLVNSPVSKSNTTLSTQEKLQSVISPSITVEHEIQLTESKLGQGKAIQPNSKRTFKHLSSFRPKSYQSSSKKPSFSANYRHKEDLRPLPAGNVSFPSRNGPNVSAQAGKKFLFVVLVVVILSIICTLISFALNSCREPLETDSLSILPAAKSSQPVTAKLPEDKRKAGKGSEIKLPIELENAPKA